VTIETVLTKRKAKFTGEIGLFPANELAAEELALANDGTELWVRASSAKNTGQLKYVWALARLISQQVDGLHDIEDAMEYLCVKARFVKHTLNPVTGQLEITRKSMRRLSQEAMRRLIKRFQHVTATEIVPGLKESTLRNELIKMVQ
jgi:hypothetical protein